MIDDLIVANAYEIHAVPVLISYIHATAGFLAKETWLRAIEAILYSSWPGISHYECDATLLNLNRRHSVI